LQEEPHKLGFTINEMQKSKVENNYELIGLQVAGQLIVNRPAFLKFFDHQ
jgi:hypothetical protein